MQSISRFPISSVRFAGHRRIMLVGVVASCALAACGPAQKTDVATTEAKLVASSTLPAPFYGSGFIDGGKCVMEMVNGSKDTAPAVEYAGKGGLAIEGWAFDDAEKTVPAAIVLQLVSAKGTFYALAERNKKHPELATSFGVPAYAEAGYSVNVDTAAMPPGVYDVLLLMKRANINIVCSTSRQVRLT